ncbi:MAG: PEP/pyruvate-binding domain-containing protein [Planctomycetota bacterium]
MVESAELTVSLHGTSAGTRRFNWLMPRRVSRVLLVSSLYDKFVLDTDGGLSERLIACWLDLSLGYPPRIERVATRERALERLASQAFDLVVMVGRLDSDEPDFGRQVKSVFPDMPVMLLAQNIASPRTAIAAAAQAGLDGVFVWNGDASLLMSMVLTLEDRLNVDHDTAAGDVRVIVVVEDSPHFYSTFLPLLYGELVRQTRSVIADTADPAQRMSRQRARPKVLLATSFEEAIDLTWRHSSHLMGCISDVSIPRDGGGTCAGLDLVQSLRRINSHIPVLIHSADDSWHAPALRAGAAFVNKNNPDLLREIRRFINDRFGFGDFTFRYPDGRVAGRATNLHSMVEIMHSVPDECLDFHTSRRDFSAWFRARTEFEAAVDLDSLSAEPHSDGCTRRALLRVFNELECARRRVELVDIDRADSGSRLIRAGSGSLGGKARGIAFGNFLIYRNGLDRRFAGLPVDVPRTAVVATDAYDDLEAMSRLDQLSDLDTVDDEEIAQRVLSCPVPPRLEADLRRILELFGDVPLAVRSSSLLEDALFRPFAGVYKTKMIPNADPDPEARFGQLLDAFRLVVASTWFRGARSYRAATRREHLHLDAEKMAVVIQEVVGKRHGNRFYPEVSGVARSWNCYPTDPARPDEGVVNLAFGLGKTVVDGGLCLTYSPARPGTYTQFAGANDWLQSQSRYWHLQLDATPDGPAAQCSDAEFLVESYLADAANDGSLDLVVSTWDPESEQLIEGLRRGGVPVPTFAPILRSERLPLNDLLVQLLDEFRDAMACDVEIEFAVTIDRATASRQTPDARFWLLQVRPVAVNQPTLIVDLEVDGNALCWTRQALGNGEIALHDIVYLPPERYSRAANGAIANELGAINARLLRENRHCLLIGFGRWGSSDPWLGIPVDWPRISQARAIVEAQPPDLAIDPSQGSHFFHNLNSQGVLYFTLHFTVDHRPVAFDQLDGLGVCIHDTEHVRHIRLDEPLVAQVDGRAGEGVIRLPRRS